MLILFSPKKVRILTITQISLLIKITQKLLQSENFTQVRFTEKDSKEWQSKVDWKLVISFRCNLSQDMIFVTQSNICTFPKKSQRL